MKSVALSIENKVREFDGKLWLALNLVDRGYDVTIGPSWEIKYVLDEINPDIYFTKDPGDGNTEFFEKLHDAGIVICGIAPEVGVNSSVDIYAKNRQEILDYIDIFFAWGEKTAESFYSYYPSSQIKNKIKVTGNPRFDLVTKGLRSIYASDTKNLKREYNNYILINTNFGLGNPAHREQAYSKLKEVHPDRDPYTEGITESRVLYSFIDLVFYFLSEDIEENIIIRPHPGEDHSTYRNIFQAYDGVYIEHYGDVRPWIAGATSVIHYDCTTGIESALMETPVLSYQNIDNDSETKPLSQVVSHEVTSQTEVMNFIKSYRSSNDPYKMNNRQKDAVKSYFPNIDELAAPKICDIIDDLPVSDDIVTADIYENLFWNKIELGIKSSRLGPEVIRLYDYIQDQLNDNSYQLSRAKQRQKFPGLSDKELNNKIQRFFEHVNIDSITIDSIPKTRHSYKIQYAKY